MHFAQKGQFKGRWLLDRAGSLVWWLAEDREKDRVCFISHSTLVYATGKRIREISPSGPSQFRVPPPPTELEQKAKVSTYNERSVWYVDTPWDRKQGHTIPGVLLACYQARDTWYQGCSAPLGVGGLSRNRPQWVRPPVLQACSARLPALSRPFGLLENMLSARFPETRAWLTQAIKNRAVTAAINVRNWRRGKKKLISFKHTST